MFGKCALCSSGTHLPRLSRPLGSLHLPLLSIREPLPRAGPSLRLHLTLVLPGLRARLQVSARTIPLTPVTALPFPTTPPACEPRGPPWPCPLVRGDASLRAHSRDTHGWLESRSCSMSRQGPEGTCACVPTICIHMHIPAPAHMLTWEHLPHAYMLSCTHIYTCTWDGHTHTHSPTPVHMGAHSYTLSSTRAHLHKLRPTLTPVHAHMHSHMHTHFPTHVPSPRTHVDTHTHCLAHTCSGP